MRQFLLRPSPLVNQLLLFCLAVAALRFGVVVHAVCFMSSHYHFVVTDPDARLPEFARWLDAILARALNALHGRWESVWRPGSYTPVRLDDEESIVGACAYALANPVKAGLVREGHQWPGVRLGPDQMRPIEARRPHFFFRDDGPLPRTASLRLSAPPCFSEEPEAFAQRVRQATAALEENARREAAAEHRGFLGRRAVLSQSPTASASSREQRRIIPKVACRDRSRKAEILRTLREFLVAYRDAWHRYVAGDRAAVFPAGTYALRVRHGVRCEPCRAPSG